MIKEDYNVKILFKMIEDQIGIPFEEETKIRIWFNNQKIEYNEDMKNKKLIKLGITAGSFLNI